MDPFSAPARPAGVSLPARPPIHLHSTTALLSSAVQFAHDSLQDHMDDYADAHRWLDSFFHKLDGQTKGPASHGQPRAAVSDFDFMKTPGRKRAAGANSTNTAHLQRMGSNKAKDPLATLLFPTAPSAHSIAHADTDKENESASPAPQRSTTPRKLLSPLGVKAPRHQPSPMRTGSPAVSKQRSTASSPRVGAKASEPSIKALDFVAPQSVAEPDEPAEVPIHDLSNVLEEEEEEEMEEPEVDDNKAHEASILLDEERVDLSIIGEEEEEEDNHQDDVSAEKGTNQLAPSDTPATVVPPSQSAGSKTASAVEEEQSRQPVPSSPNVAPAHLPTALPLSPQRRTVSGASSVAPEADDTEDMSVPLNDAPSVLRSANGSGVLRSSLSASTVRTPGSSSSRFVTPGSISSAAKTGLGSSPPQTAPSTVGPSASSLASSARTSTGGSGARQINFVGLSKKKSLGLGLGLGRNWAASVGSSAANDSQSSIQSGPVSQSAHPTNAAPTLSGSTMHSINAPTLEAAHSEAMTATGATKRKSLAESDSAHKAQKVDTAPRGEEQEAEEARKRREALANRMQSMQARQSNLGGRASNVAGPNAFASSIFGQNRALGGTGPSLFHATSTGPASKPLLAATSSTTLPSTTSSVHLASVASHGIEADSANLARRPSVMERVKSFEHNTTGQEHLHPPSPSKIPSALASSTHSPRAMSPPPGAMSPRGLRLASPTAPASPRALPRSATSGLPLATFGSPRLAGMTRSPQSTTISTSLSTGAPLSISSILSPRSSAAVQQRELPKPQQPMAQPQAQVKASVADLALSPARGAQATKTVAQPVRSMTPAGSPPPTPSKLSDAAGVLGFADEDDGLDGSDEEEEDEILTIRAINASTPASAVVAAEQAAARARAQAAAEKSARDLEEQEADRERAALLAKRLPSLPEVRAPADEESEEEEAEPSVVHVATKEDLGNKASPSKIVMPGTFGSASNPQAKEASSVEASEAEDVDDEAASEEEEDNDEEEDRTTMSVLSTATTTLNLSHQPFKPITKTAQLTKPINSSSAKSSLASSVASTAALGLNRSTGAASGIKKPVETKVKSIQRAAVAAKKEKEEADRKNAVKEQKRTLAAQKKQEEERKLKIDVLEKKRKEREEAASKVKAGSNRGVKPKPAAEEEPMKKRKIESEVKARPEHKKIGQPTRPIAPSSTSVSQQGSSLALSQGRPGAMGPPALNKSAGPSSALNKPVGPAAAFSNPLSKSAGASSMVGQSFMSAKIRLPDSSTASVAHGLPPRPLAPTVPKPFSSSIRPPQPAPAPPKVVEPQEPLQELPDIDSEYSDSDDEAHERKNAALPRWAQSPVLAQALLDQQQVNPDEIFGPIPKLAIGDFFRNSASAARLRARTSSAQWDGTDGLTQTDLARYQRAMGYKTGLHIASSAHSEVGSRDDHHRG